MLTCFDVMETHECNYAEIEMKNAYFNFYITEIHLLILALRNLYDFYKFGPKHFTSDSV